MQTALHTAHRRSTIPIPPDRLHSSLKFVDASLVPAANDNQCLFSHYVRVALGSMPSIWVGYNPFFERDCVKGCVCGHPFVSIKYLAYLTLHTLTIQVPQSRGIRADLLDLVALRLPLRFVFLRFLLQSFATVTSKF